MMDIGLYFSALDELKREILDEMHSFAYAMHLGNIKIYRTLQKIYWWVGIQREIAKHVTRCLICQQVKAKR